MLDAGIHFGHRCARWNPKMEPYIYGKRNQIHIIDIRETLRGLLRAQKYIARVVSKGDDVLFVGTKRQARDIVERHATECKMHYVSERWLGGTLTNFRTIRSRLQRLEELEALVDSPEWETGYSKKMKSMLARELQKIRRNLGGIRNMARLPGVLVAIDVSKESNALREARALKIPTICLLDTDADPDMVDVPIPGNDDAMRGIDLIMRELARAAQEGLKGRPVTPDRGEAGEAPGTGPRRPRRRIPEGEAPPAPAPPPASAPAESVAPENPAPETVSVPASGSDESSGEEPSS